MKIGKFWSIAPWILVPVLTFAGIDAVLRQIASEFPGWYYKVHRQLESERIDYLFVGSSRVMAALDSDAFEKEHERLSAGDVHVESLARGNISLIHTVLALRRIAEERPGRLRGTVVMFEVPGGLPPVFGTWKDTARGWEAGWAEVGKNPQLLARVLDGKELPKFWQSPTSFEAKAAVTVRWALKGLVFYDEQERVHDEFMSAGRKLMRTFLTGSAGSRQLDLNDAGGIRTDADAAGQIQTTVIEEAQRLERDARSYGDWQQSLLPEFVEIADREGMEIVFFHMPQSSFLEKASKTPVRLQDARRFAELADRWDASIVTFPFPVSDDDFPDGLHLRKAESAPFSQALARAWLRARQLRAEGT